MFNASSYKAIKSDNSLAMPFFSGVKGPFFLR